ncbi:hypothetical protein [Nocardia sp. NPDC051570]|uniref:hypothetical protein n=1 Tax=Nocardia sp. NPDC051570 TaxID=3364324 RepID=UPI0037A69FD0
MLTGLVASAVIATTMGANYASAKTGSMAEINDGFCQRVKVGGMLPEFYQKWAKALDDETDTFKPAGFHPFYETRKALYGDGELTAKTAKMYCEGTGEFMEKFEQLKNKHRTGYKPEYDTEKARANHLKKKEEKLEALLKEYPAESS